jgi:hypothetical protein
MQKYKFFINTRKIQENIWNVIQNEENVFSGFLIYFSTSDAPDFYLFSIILKVVPLPISDHLMNIFPLW